MAGRGGERESRDAGAAAGAGGAIRDGARVRLGISACLLGESVRYDQDHRRDRYLTEVLGRWVVWVPVCPEMESGMGSPRPTIRLERTPAGVRAVVPETREDVTGRLERHAAERAPALLAARLDGFVLKARSPSCGPVGLPVFDSARVASRDGTGVFATALARLDPELPCIDEAGLRDRRLRLEFLIAVFTRCRSRAHSAGSAPPGSPPGGAPSAAPSDRSPAARAAGLVPEALIHADPERGPGGSAPPASS